MPVLDLISVPTLTLLAVANSLPVAVSMMLGSLGSAPIDGGRVLGDGRALFGAHKTWRGLASGVLATSVVGVWLGVGLWVGAATGLLALLGDLLSSYAKRRLGRPSGQELMLLDQLPEALLPMVFLAPQLKLGLAIGACTLAVFILAGIVAARVFTYRRAPPAHRHDS